MSARMDSPRTAEEWRVFLEEVSAKVLEVADDEGIDVSDDQRAAGWLGHEGAGEERIAALEERLGTRLPPSLRTFLSVTDGWSHLGSFLYELRSTEDIDWLRRAEPRGWEILRGARDGEEPGHEEDRMMDRALLVSREADALYWLLDPGDVSEDGEWAAYIWASWYPGLGERHASFADLVADEVEGFEDLVRANEADGLNDLVRPEDE
ncbi:SMI1/KNR4 family protein [Nocardiopsis suaedae]|uniref:SMI1/KNR4 family protein n=1 Tax=Nocardiopsis suaedae TaxID=3018444 RepID=A0ABT4TNT2_9ACTN|nr:SMI1/KNR4 family protein [Nocardiopsis suaedae]MDA2806031.1 SMI1/KNR4 family protein [Nocardiopsis suaedae]